MDRCAIVISLELGHGLFGCSFLFFIGFFFRISRIHPTDQVQVKCFFFIISSLMRSVLLSADIYIIHRGNY